MEIERERAIQNSLKYSYSNNEKEENKKYLSEKINKLFFFSFFTGENL